MATSGRHWFPRAASAAKHFRRLTPQNRHQWRPEVAIHLSLVPKLHLGTHLSAKLPFVERSHRRPRAFTLIELLVVLAIMAVLTGIAWPVYQHIVQASRAAACMSNLRQIGSALNLYLGEHNMVMPALKAGRAHTTDDVPVIDNTLNAYAPDPKVFACPGDTSGQAATTGTSYFWNVALSGQGMSTLNFFNHTGVAMIPVVSDKGAYHPYIPSRVNLLYADGHTDKEISFASPSPAP